MTALYCWNFYVRSCHPNFIHWDYLESNKRMPIQNHKDAFRYALGNMDFFTSAIIYFCRKNHGNIKSVLSIKRDRTKCRIMAMHFLTPHILWISCSGFTDSMKLIPQSTSSIEYCGRVEYFTSTKMNNEMLIIWDSFCIVKIFIPDCGK